MSFIYHIRGLKTVDWKQDQPGFSLLYGKFLDYVSFYGLVRPRIICEGKTDNIYLRSAMLALQKKYPQFIDPNPKIGLTINFFNYTKRSSLFQELSGGTGEMNKLLASYRTRLSHFQHETTHPVLMIVDNDLGSNGLFKHISKILGKAATGDDPFYYIFENLYVIPVPKSGAAPAAIEDLFDPALLKRTIDAKEFDRSGKEKDTSKWYSKFDFATKIVKPERTKLDFSKFEPLLAAILNSQEDFAKRRSTLKRAA